LMAVFDAAFGSARSGQVERVTLPNGA